MTCEGCAVPLPDHKFNAWVTMLASAGNNIGVACIISGLSPAHRSVGRSRSDSVDLTL